MKVQPNPYAIGKWNQVFIESTGSAYVLGDADIEVSVNGNYLIMPEGFHVLDVIYDITGAEGTATNLSPVIRLLADGDQAIALPPKANFDSAYIYIFGY